MKHANISIFIPHLGCPFNCIFCDQYKITGSDSYVTPLDVYNILDKAYTHKTKSIKNTQIAFFGGSFTAIDRQLMIDYLETANNFIGKDGFDSIRISTRPDCIDEETLEILKKYNVKTIELGIQSLCDDVLKASKRGHTVKDCIDSCNLIKNYGFELGMQMMCGLPCDSFEKDVYTAQKIIEIGCKQVRIYPVVVIQGTKLCDMYNSKIYTPLTVDEAVKTCAHLYKMFENNGVTVLKMGLHTDSGCVAGPFHPAFGELVRSEVFYNDVITKINKLESFLIKTSISFESTAKGNAKRNLERFKNNGYNVQIQADATLNNKNYVIIKKTPV